MLTARDYHGDEFWKAMKTDFDQLMAFRKTIKGKPTECERLQLDLNQIWIDYYKTALFHTEGRSNCDCRMCELKKQAKQAARIKV